MIDHLYQNTILKNPKFVREPYIDFGCT